MPKKKDYTGDPGSLIGDAIWGVVQPLYKEAKRRERSASAPSREKFFGEEKPLSQKAIVFEVLPQAIRNAGANFSTRDLYYAVRALAYRHARWPAGKKLDYKYFSGELITTYEETYGRLPEGHYRDPRGNLIEPHSGKSVPLGTREVGAYEFPDYLFHSILYIEKEGELPKLQAAQFPERYDMAICSGKGHPSEAVRSLFERAEEGEYQLFVFHDADLSGLDIARVMREETRRMPGYSVEVVDLGLSIEDAVEMGLDPEPFSQKHDISAALKETLTPLAREYLYNRTPSGGVRGQRFEINSILPDTRRVEYIEKKLREHGVVPKLIPPPDALKDRLTKMYLAKVDDWVDELVDEIIGTTVLKKTVGEDFEEAFKLQDAEGLIKAGFARDDTKSWRHWPNATLERDYKSKHKEAMRKVIWKCIKEKAKEVESEDE